MIFLKNVLTFRSCTYNSSALIGIHKSHINHAVEDGAWDGGVSIYSSMVFAENFKHVSALGIARC